MKSRKVLMRLTLAAVAASSAMTWATVSPPASLAAPGQESASRTFHDDENPPADPVTQLLCMVPSSDPKCAPGH